MARYDTQPIRSMSIQPLRILVLKKLAPLSSMVGANFVKAWLEIVNCHAVLWSRNFEYGDTSLWNLMYNNDLNCGVLIDHDLSRNPRHGVPGRDRTGAIPFRALALLSREYWHGNIERQYRHELEAFIWILPFVFLLYRNGESQQGTLVDPWMTPNYTDCIEKKSSFRFRALHSARWQCESSFVDHWILVEALVLWLAVIDERAIAKSNTETNDSLGLTLIWPTFIEQLKLVAKRYPSLDYLNGLVDELGLESPVWARKCSVSP